ncbi:uroporphyrin-III C-methyltransferase (uroporphyrinogen III methylase) [Pedobacter sp. BAL39]|uniref:uroporphyrinogen-III C-methyltransferase n=1 Tax=Pedobacter sp. BAL39 TaxID=391596 RepID=UPI0001559BC6|nr:uroporphyrinogen-III C-methyltransferase [Pedobacter sp. BAL39]EDM37000.1 uroporphyrin-III C-methyltransferase (uroporphyrinogen III methylase) [Pedobacter sp. BAL39]
MILSKIENSVREPKITLVGAGPGDPELISLKGVKAINCADVVIYDAQVNEALLNHAPEKAIKIFVGDKADDESFSQDAVNKLMIDYALNFGHVVRLKSGDPFVFAKGFEEVDFAESYSIVTEIIPGISSALGVPGLHRIPMTYRNLSESFWVLSGINDAGEISPDLCVAAKSKATVVVLMGIDRIREIAAIFQNEGKHKLPVAVIENGSSINEQMRIAVVDTIAEVVEDYGISTPALLVFGDVVSLHPSFDRIRDFYEVLAMQ